MDLPGALLNIVGMGETIPQYRIICQNLALTCDLFDSNSLFPIPVVDVSNECPQFYYEPRCPNLGACVPDALICVRVEPICRIAHKIVLKMCLDFF
jgi:hypothetical protein